MVENDENDKASRFDVNSKFMRIFLVLFSVFLIFVGPTYISYVLYDALKVNYAASVISGFVLFIAGLALILFLIKKKIIT